MTRFSVQLMNLLILGGVFAGIATLLSSRVAHAELIRDQELKRARFALVVGSNATLDARQAPLRFADDDAARVAELLAENGVEVELLSTFDTESQARFAKLVPFAKRATAENVRAAMKRLSARASQESAKGIQSEFLFYYSGHGDIGGDGRSYLTLEDGPLTRQDLFQGILSLSGAKTNHVILDACRSEEFVLTRGDWKDDRVRSTQTEAVQKHLEAQTLSHFPNTGVILASSVDQQTHEWERYRGGIFTHELLSGLRGAADINGDGAIEYSELGGFVSAANRGVADPRARLAVIVHPPSADQRAPILSYVRPEQGRVLYFRGGASFRYQIEDARGVRLADLRRSPGRPAYVRVPKGTLFVHRGERGESEAQISAQRGGLVDIEALHFVDSARAARGALDEAFRHGLFEVPFGEGYYAGYTESTSLLAVADPAWQVQVWRRNAEGELVEVARIAGEDDEDKDDAPAPNPEDAQATAVDAKADAEAAQADAEADAEEHERELEELEEHLEELQEDLEALDDDESEADEHHAKGPKHPRKHELLWGAVSLGLEFTPYNPEGEIIGQPKRIIANEFHGFSSSGFGRPLRGFDLRWWGFDAWNAGDFPGSEAYFRTGFTRGNATFSSASPRTPLSLSAAAKLDYFTVPLFFAGNIYAFERFPLRPFVGAGVGFDVLSLEYTRVDERTKHDVSARIGFELHAGLDLRINNWFSFVGEVRQLWSARRKMPGLPDYSNEGLTLVTSLRVGFPLTEQPWRKHGRDKP
jgi:hypothetical protein